MLKKNARAAILVTVTGGVTVAVGVTVTGTDHHDWRYDYVLAMASPQARVHAANDETADLGWVDLAREPWLPLHAGLRRDWSRLVDAVRDVVSGAVPG